jgi:two-component system sensor histidine kinase AlgZ
MRDARVQQRDATGEGAPQSGLYLPDFCAPRNVLAVVLIAELVAMLLTLARYGIAPGFWIDLARTSMFLLWIGLGSAAVLCVTRPRLQRLDVRRGSAAALALLLGVTALVSEGAWWLARSSGSMLGIDDGTSLADHVGFVLRNLFVGAIVGGLALRYFYVLQQWRRNVEAEAQSRVRALQARIRPHFLFNSMNTIASLTQSDPRAAEEAIAALADLFRASLGESRQSITVAEEIEVARTYERIERQRLGDRLRVDWRVDELPLSAVMPALLLQPLLENAVYHGIERLPGGGVITVQGRRDGRFVEITVENPVAPGAPVRAGSRHGLESVRQRLALMYPGEARVTIEPLPASFRVTLRFPLKEPGEDG